MKPAVGIAVVLALLSAGFLFWQAGTFSPAEAPPPLRLYASDAFGLSFAYPEGYILSEDASGVTLIREEDAVPVIAGGEGPTAITLVFHPEDPAFAMLSEWILGTHASNARLGSGGLVGTSVDGRDALYYQWSGLYEGETVAFLHDSRIVLVSATYRAPSDPIREAFRVVLGTLRFR